MKRKIVSLLFTAIVTTSCVLSVQNTVYAADTVQSVTSINSDGKLIVDGTGVTIDSADIETMQQAINTNATILTDVQDLAEQNETNIAQTSDEYSSSKTYKKGQLCIKDGSLYKCKVDIDTAEAWTSSHWTKTSLASVSGNLSSEVSDLSDSLTASDSTKFRFATDGEGNYGFLGADGSLIPFTGNLDEFAISFTCVGRGDISFVYDKEIDASVTSNYESRHFKIDDVHSFTVTTDGEYRVIRLYSYASSYYVHNEKVVSDTNETLNANTVINARSYYPDATGTVSVVIVIPLS